MNSTEITAGQLEQLFEIQRALRNCEMRGLRKPLQDLIEAHRGKTGNHRVQPGLALWKTHRLPGFDHFEDYLEGVPHNPIHVPSWLEQYFNIHGTLVDSRYSIQLLAGAIKLPNLELLHDVVDVGKPGPYWIAGGLCTQSQVDQLRSEHAGSKAIRPMTVLEGLCWFLQHRHLVSVGELRIRLAGSLGILPDGREIAPDLVVAYPWTRLTIEPDHDKSFVFGMCLAKESSQE